MFGHPHLPVGRSRSPLNLLESSQPARAGQAQASGVLCDGRLSDRALGPLGEGRHVVTSCPGRDLVPFTVVTDPLPGVPLLRA